MRISRRIVLGGAVAAFAIVGTGCATKGYVREEVGVTNQRLDDVQSQVESAQTQLRDHDNRIDEASRTAQEALQRAIAAGKLTEGAFVFETVLSDDKVKFPFDSSSLSDEARLALDAFADQVSGEDGQGVYIEIQGHTDSTGSEEYNLELGEERATAVWRYLNQQHKFALTRMNTISYGESEPVADNGTREGRASNRRVVLVVLR